jgi:hypothetical protein
MTANQSVATLACVRTPRQPRQAARPALRQNAPVIPAHTPLPLWVVATILLLAACAILQAWATPEPATGDLFVALAGGRDVVDGKLGQPDDWSFTTAGHIWINQNWLSHLLMFLAWRVGGPAGLLLLKAALLAAMACFLCLLSLRRGCTAPVAILLSAGLIMGCHLFIDMRANLLTLMILPLWMWMLYRTIDNPHRIWWALPVILAWANLHGGFVFGLGMLGLWAACTTLQNGVRLRRNPLPTDWPLWACAAACTAAAAISPFGIQNLTHPFLVISSAAWRDVNEWRPLLESPLPIPWGFFAALGLAILLAALRGLDHLRQPRPVRRGNQPTSALRTWLFTGLLSTVVVIMAFQSWRLVPTAVLVLAAPLASSLAHLTQRFGRKALAGLSACVLAGALLLLRQNLVAYWPTNPVQRGTTIFERMHDLPQGFPVRAAQFLADNRINDNVFCDWAWEGYLRWVCPGVKLFIGGRAQQIYSHNILAVYNRLDDPQAAPDLLQKYQVHLTVLSANELGYARMSGLLASGRWTCIYSDGQVMILTDTQAGSQLVQQALANQLMYPSEAIRALSRVLCLTTAPPSAEPSEILSAAKAANALRPARQAYYTVGSLGRTPSLRPEVIQYLTDESTRLVHLPDTPDDRVTILQCRGAIQAALAQLYRDAGQPDAARNARAHADALLTQIRDLIAGWEYLPAPLHRQP